MDPIYVPGEKGGVQLKVFKYLLDCQEKTVDRKSDMADADGGIKKLGWIFLMIPLQFTHMSRIARLFLDFQSNKKFIKLSVL